MWIEQLAAKRIAVGAAKCVAISLSPFSKPAIEKAKRLGVELRNLRRFDGDEISNLAPLVSLHYLCSFDRVSVTFADGMGPCGEVLELDDKLNDLLWNKLGHSIKDRLVYYHDSDRVRSIGDFIINVIDAAYDHCKEG